MAVDTRAILAGVAEDPEALSDGQIEELRGDLQRLAVELEAQIEGRAEGAAVVDLEAPMGRLSRMDAMAQQQVIKAGREAARRRLGMVRAALQRIEDGDYGYCLRSGEPIGYRRLKVKPEATLSIAGQADLERR